MGYIAICDHGVDTERIAHVIMASTPNGVHFDCVYDKISTLEEGSGADVNAQQFDVEKKITTAVMMFATLVVQRAMTRGLRIAHQLANAITEGARRNTAISLIVGTDTVRSPETPLLWESIPRVSIAPMLDRTDRHFRYMARLLTGRATLYTEMISDSAVRFQYAYYVSKMSGLIRYLSLFFSRARIHSLISLPLPLHMWGFLLMPRNRIIYSYICVYRSYEGLVWQIRNLALESTL